MNKFSKKSQERLSTCHPDLQRLCEAVLQEMDITVLYGHRGKEEQDKAYAEGKSKLKFPESKHNKLPSLAVDCCPYPVSWSNKESFIKMGELFKRKAAELGIKIRWGGDFKSFFDGPHIELVL